MDVTQTKQTPRGPKDPTIGSYHAVLYISMDWLGSHYTSCWEREPMTQLTADRPRSDIWASL